MTESWSKFGWILETAHHWTASPSLRAWCFAEVPAMASNLLYSDGLQPTSDGGVSFEHGAREGMLSLQIYHQKAFLQMLCR